MKHVDKTASSEDLAEIKVKKPLKITHLLIQIRFRELTTKNEFLK